MRVETNSDWQMGRGRPVSGRTGQDWPADLKSFQLLHPLLNTLLLLTMSSFSVLKHWSRGNQLSSSLGLEGRFLPHSQEEPSCRQPGGPRMAQHAVGGTFTLTSDHWYTAARTSCSAPSMKEPTGNSQLSEESPNTAACSAAGGNLAEELHILKISVIFMWLICGYKLYPILTLIIDVCLSFELPFAQRYLGLKNKDANKTQVWPECFGSSGASLFIVTVQMASELFFLYSCSPSPSNDLCFTCILRHCSPHGPFGYSNVIWSYSIFCFLSFTPCTNHEQYCILYNFFSSSRSWTFSANNITTYYYNTERQVNWVFSLIHKTVYPVCIFCVTTVDNKDHFCFH